MCSNFLFKSISFQTLQLFDQIRSCLLDFFPSFHFKCFPCSPFLSSFFQHICITPLKFRTEHPPHYRTPSPNYIYILKIKTKKYFLALKCSGLHKINATFHRSGSMCSFPLVLNIPSLFLSLSRSPFLDDSAKDLCNPGERFSQIRFLLNKFTQYSYLDTVTV